MEVSITTLSINQIVGEIALQNKERINSKTARALAETKCWKWDKDYFIDKISYLNNVHKIERV